MSLKDSLKAAASLGFASGVLLAQSSPASAANDMKHEPASGVKCFGVQTCKGNATCAVTSEQIKVANQVFKNKFKNAKAHSCGGSNSCGAQEGFLEWVQRPSEKECLTAGGFVYKKKKDPKTKKEILTIKKS
ncbi:MAG: hypothetical protein RJB13_1989 [Pseudomonadota bacterium]|jgi:hypothetical protein